MGTSETQGKKQHLTMPSPLQCKIALQIILPFCQLSSQDCPLLWSSLGTK